MFYNDYNTQDRTKRKKICSSNIKETFISSRVFATELANQGIPYAKIQEMEKWKSNAFMNYISQQ